MPLESIIHKIDRHLERIGERKLKYFAVGTSLAWSVGGLYLTIKTASEGDCGTATIGGVVTIAQAYYAGYQSKKY